MKFNFEFDEENEILKIKVTCLLSQDIRKGILQKVASLLKTRGFSRVIIDLTETTFDPAEPMLGALELINYLKFVGIKPHVKIAFIYSEAEAHRKFFEAMAQSEGYNLRYFHRVSEATVWLK